MNRNESSITHILVKIILLVLLAIKLSLDSTLAEIDKELSWLIENQIKVKKLKEENIRLNKYNDELEELMMSRKFFSTPEANTSE